MKGLLVLNFFKYKWVLVSLILASLSISLSLVSWAEEIGQSSNQVLAPEKSLIPKARPKSPSKPNAGSNLSSLRPFPRPTPLRELTSQEIEALQARPCPGSEDCPGPYRNFDLDGQSFSPLCEEFITKDGDYGETGILMIEAMQKIENTKLGRKPDGTFAKEGCRFNDSFDFGRACPNFKYMSPLQKQHVWVWVWASIAQAESSCDPAKEAKGIYNEVLGRYNIADGLFGLEYAADTRAVAGRDAAYCPHKPEEDSKNLFFQTRCAASILYDNQCGEGVINSDSYWEKARTNQRQISLLIQRHPLCKP